MMADEPELLPCPFCGGVAKLQEYDNAEQSWIIICCGCHASSAIAVLRDKPIKQKLANLWNARAGDAS
jgi:Lar family restriction alleviation protein